jgi:hypothetical protein
MATDVVGREQELATVAGLLDQRRAGPWVVIIEGDGGIGKDGESTEEGHESRRVLDPRYPVCYIDTN